LFPWHPIFKEVEVLLFLFSYEEERSINNIRNEAAKMKQLLLASHYFVDRWNPTFNKPILVVIFVINDQAGIYFYHQPLCGYATDKTTIFNSFTSQEHDQSNHVFLCHGECQHRVHVLFVSTKSKRVRDL